MICPTCGTNNPDDAAFCPNCGAAIQNSVPNGAPTPNQNPYGNGAPNPGAVPPPPTAMPQYTGTPVPPNMGGGIQQRNIALCIILSIVTCGIYGLYWIYTMTEDTNHLMGDPNATSGGIVILLSIVTCGIYMWFWMYKKGEQLDQIKSSRGVPSSNSGVLYLILSIVGLSIVSYALIQNELNAFAA